MPYVQVLALAVHLLTSYELHFFMLVCSKLINTVLLLMRFSKLATYVRHCQYLVVCNPSEQSSFYFTDIGLKLEGSLVELRPSRKGGCTVYKQNDAVSERHCHLKLNTILIKYFSKWASNVVFNYTNSSKGHSLNYVGHILAIVCWCFLQNLFAKHSYFAPLEVHANSATSKLSCVSACEI